MKANKDNRLSNSLKEKYRLVQSRYRETYLKEPSGVGPYKNSTKIHGNMLVNGELTGSNFISRIAFNYAKQKVLDKEVNKFLTIDEYRLFNNMLSSMPMCFNLFSDLRQLLLENQLECSKIIRQLFVEIPLIEEVCFIDIEFIPIPIENYIGDRTAFDTIIIYKARNGYKGVISVETKYTDVLGENTSVKTEQKSKFALELFSKSLQEELKINGYNQIHRNILLTFSFAKKNKCKYFHNVIISPEEDNISVEQINELKLKMIRYKNSIFKISLEEIVKRGMCSTNERFSVLMRDFKNRYII